MLTWDDQNTLATLASEQGETRTLSQPAREDWFGVADRLLAGWNGTHQ